MKCTQNFMLITNINITSSSLVRRKPPLMLPVLSKQLMVSQDCVQSAIKKYKQLDRFNDLKHTGRPKKLSDREICHLKRLVKAGSLFSVSKIATNLNASLP